ncbi:MAG: hypothetical protein KAJ07_00340 [Planctomycetes bacterium]|nr:hypothetical protein [Planctomycetota bacterium]
MKYGGMPAVLAAVTKHKEGRTLKQVYKKYQEENEPAMKLGSCLVYLTRLIAKGCVERPTEGHYRATGKAFFSLKGKTRTKESKYVIALRELGGRATAIQIMDRLNRNADRQVTLTSALVYLSRLKSQGLVEQAGGATYRLPKEVI